MLSQTFPIVQTVGFSPSDGHYVMTEDGERIAISRAQYFQIRFLMAEVEDQEPDYDDLADYLAGLQIGISMF